MKVKKDLESLLRGALPEPTRSLNPDFTQEIVRRLDQAEHTSGTFSRLWAFLKLKRLAPLALGLITVISILTAGTVYAALQGWPNIATFFSGEIHESTGSRIVKVDTTNCSSLDVPLAFQYTYSQDQSISRYFRIKRDSKLTNEDVVRMVQGYCQLGKQTQFAQTTLLPELAKINANKDVQIFGLYVSSTVERISKDSIQVMAHIPSDNGTIKNIRFSFGAIDTDVLVYDINHRINLQDIRPGDNVAINYRVPNATTPQELNPNHVNTDNETVVAITRNPPSIVAALDYLKYKKNLIEVTPCSKNPSRYCTPEEFAR